MTTAQMNTATIQMTRFLLDQYADISSDQERMIFTTEAIKDFVKRMTQDYCEEYDNEFFSLFWMDERSPCIDWQSITDAVQDMKDNHYAEYLFE